ncbi:MAG: PorV/PorQ family protein [Candidatus Marinimicrobia bacterium]|nr:PorV/PorQ family protein [Candidatus Neomarinimicrobiota bacterium]
MRILFTFIVFLGITFSQYRDIPDVVTKVATTAGNWLKLETGARGVGMAGAMVAAGTGVSAITYNPSSIGFIKGSELYYSKTNYLAGISHSSMAYGTQVTPTDFVAFYLFSFNSGKMDVTNAFFPDGTGEEFDVTGLSLRGTYAKILTDRLKFGVSIKYIRESIYTTAMQTVAIDLGSNFDTGIYGIILGMSVSNFGPDVQFSGEGLEQQVADTLSVDGTLSKLTDEFPIPMSFRLGIKKDVFNDSIHKLTVAMDGVNPIDYVVTGNIGLEYSWLETAYVRGGTHLNHDTASFTMGAGIKIGNIFVDYAFANYGILENTNQFGLRFGF